MVGKLFYKTFLNVVVVTSGSFAHAEYFDDLKSLNADLATALNRSRVQKLVDMPPRMKSEFKKLAGLCLEGDRLENFSKFVEEWYRQGNAAPVIGFFAQRFRLTPRAASLENKLNKECKDSSCRSQVINELKKEVRDPRVFELLVNAQIYPRVLHIKNMDGIEQRPSPTPNRTIFLKNGQQLWVDDNNERTFPDRGSGYPTGSLYVKNSRFMDVEICSDSKLDGYNPDFWPHDGKTRVGQFKVYLGCHPGMFDNHFFYTGSEKCKPFNDKCNSEKQIDLPREFNLTDLESQCFRMRLFNPIRPASSAPSTSESLQTIK